MFVENPTAAEFDALFRDHRFVVVDFYATWCAPCKAYSPKFQRAYRELKRQAPDVPVAFVALDIDRVQDVARRHGVKAVPTTVVLEERKGFLGRRKLAEVERFSGDRSWNDLMRTFLAALEVA